MLHHFARPDLFHGYHIVIEPRATPLKGHPHGHELLLQPADPGAQHEAAAGEEIQAGGLFCQQQRVGLGHDVYAGGQADGFGLRSDGRQGDQRIDKRRFRRHAHFARCRVGIFRLIVQRYNDMFKGPDAFKASFFSCLRHGDHLLRGDDADVDGD